MSLYSKSDGTLRWRVRQGRCLQADTLLGCVALSLVYRVILDILYALVVAPAYSYMGLTLDPDLFEYAVSIVLMLVPLLILGGSQAKPSTISLKILYLLIIVPMSSFYALSDHASNAGTLRFYFACIACFSLTCLICRVFAIRRKPVCFDIDAHVLLPVLTLIVLATLAYLVYKGGLHIEALNFSKIYGIRENQADYGTVMGYVIVWCYRVICPLLMLRGFATKRWGAACFWLAVQILFYLVLANKEILLAPLFICIIYLLLNRVSSFKAFVGIVLVCAMAASILHAALNVNYILGVVPVRLLYIPAQIMYEYHDFFSTGDFLYYSETHLSVLFGAPYPFGDSTPGNIIAMYYQGAISNSNTGYLSCAYSNGGFLSMIAESFVLAIVLAIVDVLAVSKKYGRLVALALLPNLFSLSNCSLSSVLMSGGLMLFIVIMALGGESFFERRRCAPAVLYVHPKLARGV